MKHITILATAHSNLGSIDNPRRGFLAVNDYLQQKGKAPMFKVKIAGLKREILLKNGICTIHTDSLIQDLKQTDLIIIPAFDSDIKEGVIGDSELIPWIVGRYKQGVEVASLCVGAFLLGASGLLDGRSCSTHWKAAEAFRRHFPKVRLVAEKIITDEQGLYTSGGAFSSANLILYLIEKYAGHGAAVHCAKIFQIDMDRESQSPFFIFHGQRDHEDEQVKEVQHFIEENYQDKITVDELCEKVALSRRNLERRFKKATNNTVVEYIQRVKIESVKKNLEMGNRQTINELMYSIGYNDIKSFRNLFKRYTGLSPLAYKCKYNRHAIVA